jgi:Sec7-like guanine-nucleotide exchange factor
MAHFAELNEHNIVTRIIVINNLELIDNGVESEEKGLAFCNSHYGGKWVQTSYNSNFRGKYAEIGDTFNNLLNIFENTNGI